MKRFWTASNLRSLTCAFVMANLLLVVLASCAGTAKQYVEADKATYDIVALDYASYVNSDPKLDQEQKDRRIRLLDTWKLRIDKGLK